MTGLISIYLDIFRFVAAMGVFWSHAEQHSAAPGVLPPLYFDHKLVIFFFVISGYVIAASASRPDRTLANYSADRLARLSSVVIPALVLTYLLDTIGAVVSPEVYASFPNWQPLRFLVNFFYCQQIWFLSVNPSCNTPMWSLGYEFWYYAMFAVWIFVKPIRARYLLLLTISLFIGPKILLLLPAWVIGAIAFHAGKLYKFSFQGSLLLFVVSGIALLFCGMFVVQLHLTNGIAGRPPLYYSADWLGDNIFSVIIAFHFFSCAAFSKHVLTNLEPYKIVKLIRWLASHTFSLYVYHMPLLYFIRAIGKYDPNSLSAALLAIAIALLVVVCLSKITEERYPVLRTFLRQRMGLVINKTRTVAVRLKLSAPPPETV